MSKVDVPALRTVEYVEGKPISIYAEVLVEMSEESSDIMACDPWYDEGNHFLVQWWEGYGQDPVVDVYVVDWDDYHRVCECKDTSNCECGARQCSDGFNIGSPTTLAQFNILAEALKEGQWQWLLIEQMGWDKEYIQELIDDNDLNVEWSL